jgi:drug/metabolite transporter (DMT)-like permease
MRDSRETGKTVLAFAIIYFVWGASFLAIRIGVAEVPPLLFASFRFLAAGLILSAWTVLRGQPAPTRSEWISITVLATLIFLVDYGLLFWAEQRVPSGIAAVMLAMIPVFTALSEIILLGTQRLTFRLVLALLIGTSGVVVLMSRSLDLGGAPVDRIGALALIVAATSWSVASALARKLPLPSSRVMSSATQMLVGGGILALVSLGLGDFRRFDPGAVSLRAWTALLYLVVPGSIIAFTAYVWLIQRESPTKVGTYAYVNPVVAVLLGYFAAGEALDQRTVLGTMCVLVSVVVITTMPVPGKPASHRPRDRSASG